MWRVQLWTAAALFAGLPVLNALTTRTHLGVTLFDGPAVVAGFDLTVLVLGIAFGGAAWMLGKRSAAPRKAAAPRAAQAATGVAGVAGRVGELTREASQ